MSGSARDAVPPAAARRARAIGRRVKTNPPTAATASRFRAKGDGKNPTALDRRGARPAAGLIEAGGLLYGTTFHGGSSLCSGYGCGTIFSVSTSGAEHILSCMVPPLTAARETAESSSHWAYRTTAISLGIVTSSDLLKDERPQRRPRGGELLATQRPTSSRTGPRACAAWAQDRHQGTGRGRFRLPEILAGSVRKRRKRGHISFAHSVAGRSACLYLA